MLPPQKQSGFSLVELSIVLVILGLLTGGILGGRELVKAAELRSVTSEYRQWVTAVNTFKDKYMGLPGDLDNATAFWGAADTSSGGECGAPGADTGSGTDTCNGNGDGEVEEDYEEIRFWQHLSNAGIISGNYSGVGGSGGIGHAVGGENAPQSKYSTGVWGTDHEGDSAGTSEEFALNYGQVLMLGSEASSGEPDGDLFNPEDLWNIDMKMDDGKPGQGHVILLDWGDCSDAADQNDLEADYLLDDEEIDCAAYFRNAY